MSTRIAPNPGDNLESNGSSILVEGSSEEGFDEKYNKRLEFPLSLMSAILIHVLVGAVLVFVLFYLMGIGGDPSGVPVKLVNLEGMDETGSGAVGSGGTEEDPFFKADGNPDTGPMSIADPTLPGKLPIPDANRKASDDLARLQQKLLAARQGAGSQNGSGTDNSQGNGPSGTGADSTSARNMRWVLRFKVKDGQDYLDQLKAMGAEILVPIPDSEKCILIADISKPKEQKTASDDDLKRLAKKIKFSDSRPEAVKSVCKTLGLDFSPKAFWAFFPSDIEEEVSKKELNYRNRRSEDIQETIFRVVVKEGKYEIVVEEQKIKK
jgi:hypothetical protein